MKSYSSLLLVLAFGLGTLLVVPAPAAEKADPEQVAKLIEKMGSGDFEDREKATEQLDGIGVPALEALRKASKSEDPEVRRRAEELVAKIEKRQESVKVLAPTKVRLVYKDALVAEAVKDFAKKSGYSIALLDPQNKLKNRKISLDTGEVAFWQAFELFCTEASLVAASQNDILNLQPQPIPLPVPNPFLPGNPGVIPGNPGVRPIPPGLPALPAPPVPPVPAKPPVEDKPPQPPERRQPEQEVQAPVPQARPVQAQAQAQVQAQARFGPIAQPARPPQAIGALGMGGVGGFGFGGNIGMPAVQANQITLIDGKPEKVPTDASGAVRVRISDHLKQQPKGPEGEIRLGLELTPEPKLQLLQVGAVRVEKALDDQGQKLTQVMNMAPGANPAPGQIGFGGFGGAPVPIGFGGNFGGNFGFAGVQGAASQYTAIQLKKGEKAAKTLKEVSGVITAQMMAPAQPAITVDNIMKMAGKEVKGKDGGLIKMIDVARAANGQLRVRFEFDPPANAGNPFGVQGGVFPGIQIMPVPIQINPPPVPVPLPPRKEGKAPGANPPNGPQLAQPAPAPMAQAQPARLQIAQPGQIQIQIGVGVGGPAFMPIGNIGANSGFTLIDDKGNTLQPTGFQQQIRQVGNMIKVDHVLTFQLQKGQDPAKLVYSVSKSTTIDIPFTLKDVKIAE
jgi:hypothetical protein